MKALSVKGDIDGGTGSKLVFSVDGLGGISSVKILGGMTVGGTVKNTFFNLGNNGALTSLAQIGKISVGKDWTSSTLSAGTTLDVGGTPLPLLFAQRVAELERLPSRKPAPAVNPMP